MRIFTQLCSAAALAVLSNVFFSDYIIPSASAQQIFCSSFECAVGGDGSVGTVASIDALRQAEVPSAAESSATIVYVSHHTGDDEGGGFFVWRASSIRSDDDGVVVKPNSLTIDEAGRWIRHVDRAGTVSVLWFGAIREPAEIAPSAVNLTAEQQAAGRTIADRRAERTTTAIQSALDSLALDVTSTVYFPTGRYAISTTLIADLPSVNVTLKGDGARASQLIAANGLVGGEAMLVLVGEADPRVELPDQIRFKDLGGRLPALHIQNLGFIGGVRRYNAAGVSLRTNNLALASAGVRLEGEAFTHDSQFSDLIIESFLDRCLDIDAQILGIGMTSVSIRGCDYGIYAPSLTTLQAGYAQDLRISSTQLAGFLAANSTGNGQPEFQLISPTFEANVGPAVVLQGPLNVRIVGGHIESNMQGARQTCLNHSQGKPVDPNALAAAQCNEGQREIVDCSTSGAIIRPDDTCYLPYNETFAGGDFLLEPGDPSSTSIGILSLSDMRFSTAGQSLSATVYPIVTATRRGSRILLDNVVLGQQRRILYSDSALPGSHVRGVKLPNRLPCVTMVPGNGSTVNTAFWPEPTANDLAIRNCNTNL